MQVSRRKVYSGRRELARGNTRDYGNRRIYAEYKDEAVRRIGGVGKVTGKRGARRSHFQQERRSCRRGFPGFREDEEGGVGSEGEGEPGAHDAFKLQARVHGSRAVAEARPEDDGFRRSRARCAPSPSAGGQWIQHHRSLCYPAVHLLHPTTDQRFKF
jgi:hypothetical protein